MDFFADYRWHLLLIAEVVFWISLLTAIVLKYWFRQPRAAFSVFVLTIVNELWILFLGMADMQRTDELTGFQIIVIILLLYTLFFGKHYVKKIDSQLSKIVAWMKKEPRPAREHEVKYGIAKALEEIKLFGLHILMFLSAHAVFYIFVYFEYRAEYPISPGTMIDWLREQFQRNDALVQMNKIWAALLLLDAVISFSYFLFPKKPDDNKEVNP